MYAMPPSSLPAPAMPVLVAQVEAPPATAGAPAQPLSAAQLVPVERTATKAWGLSVGGAGGAGFTYRINATDATGWTFSGSILRGPTSLAEIGLPYFLLGFKRHWILQETDKARLYGSAGSTLLYNPFPNLGSPRLTDVGGGSQGIHTVGAGYGIQVAVWQGWKIGFEVDFGLAVLWPGSFQDKVTSFILPMPELSLLYEY